MTTSPRVEPFQHGVAVSLSGELDAYDAPALREAFASLVREHEGEVVVLDENPPAEQAEGTRRAAAACPALAIHIEE